jgi:hypothetical protein
VFLAGRKLRVPLWRLIIHDYSKFAPAEFVAYRNRFFDGRAGQEDKKQDPNEFKLAWLHHIHRNPHHWEHWILRDNDPFEMPINFVREMVADWMGAGRAITGERDISSWYETAKEYQKLHPTTRWVVEALLKDHKYGR